MKVALVYDRVNKWGGAERVIVALRKMFPDSVLYTSVYKKDKASWAKKIPIVPSFLQKIPFASSYHEALAVFMPLAFESFSFDQFDLVISVTSESAKGILTKPGTRHICICLTPTRYLWSGYEEYFENKLLRLVSFPVVFYLRFWDKIAAFRPDTMIAISENVSHRIKKYYGLSSAVIYPPLMIKNFKYAPYDGKYFLVVSRLVPYKRIDIAIKAANKLKLKLKIIGAGSELERLQEMAGPTIEFMGSVTDDALKQYYAGARALIFPGIEDFGLTMVEANAAGKPVIAFRSGGAQEIIVEGKTGEFFDRQSAASLVSVLKKFRQTRYNTIDCQKNAKRFSYERFSRMILQAL